MVSGNLHINSTRTQSFGQQVEPDTANLKTRYVIKLAKLKFFNSRCSFWSPRIWDSFRCLLIYWFALFISSYFYDWKLGPFLKEFSWQKNDKKAHFIQYYILLESLCDLSIFCNRAKWPSIRITSTYISVLYSPSIFWSNFPDISFRICSSTWFWIEKSEEFTIFRLVNNKFI